MDIVFYEKPGCKGNAKQRRKLEELGYSLDVRDMLVEPWTAETLRPYFGSRPVAEWFNQSAKKVKSGEIDPSSFDEAQALAVLIAEPMLIRRPLLKTAKGQAAGFQPGAILSAIGIDVPENDSVGEGCAATHRGQSCRPPAASSAT